MPEQTRARRLRRTRNLLGATTLVVAIGVLAGWAFAVVWAQPDAVLDTKPSLLAEVTEGEIGVTIRLSTIAQWPSTSIANNERSGTITSVEQSPGALVSPGDVLYHVDLALVAIAEGAVPAFRDIALGTKGQDVVQVQEFLSDLGFYSGVADGEVGPRTAKAISAWQDSLSLEETSSVRLGSIIFVPELPARVSLDPKLVSRGLRVTGGEPAVLGLPSSPDFAIPVSEAQANLLPTNTAVAITSPSGATWSATIGERQKDLESGQITMALKSTSEGPICGDQCTDISVGQAATLACDVTTVERLSGATIPAAAIRTTAEGATVVVDDLGRQHTITILGAAKGMAVIEGIAVGTRVVIDSGEMH